MMSKDLFYCEKCNRTMNEKQFYGSNNLEKYPDGKLRQCKKCITMHVNNWDPDTYLWILQECDVPYVPDEWHKLMKSYASNDSGVTGMTIIGRYLSKMKLKQFKDYRWKDTAFLQQLADNKTEQAMKRQGYSTAQITEVIEKGRFEVPEEELQEPVYADPEPQPTDDILEQEEIEEPLDLTDEDRLYLRLKWGRGYKPDEWVWLEKLYQEMMSSYDIQTAGHIDTLKLLCKTSLKANQLIDLGDVEGFQKLQRAYDSLMKAGKFTAAQNKAEQGEFIDSIGELVALCEKQGFIPRYYIAEPNDKVDETLRDLQRYTRTLVTEEMNLGNMIELALKDIQKEDASRIDSSLDCTDDDVIDEIERELKDKDFKDYSQFLDEQEALDQEEEE